MDTTQLPGLGDTAQDTISGFQGIVIAETKWLNGCVRLTIAPKELKDGSPVEPHTFDIQQLELVEAGTFWKQSGVEAPNAAAGVAELPGGPHAEPKRAPDPK